ncbi:MAG: dephospho-CoA kinase [Atopostipes sp.]|nr:dephospho-CoA kinase [Atopostipes sp.]
MTKTLGLTGGIASGKTTISNYFKSLGIAVIDADRVAHDLMRAGQPIVLKIAELFGEDVLHATGEINRKRLGDIIFQSDKEREKLNQLVQKKIRKEITENKKTLLEKEEELIVLDIPLLYEEEYGDMVDEIMVVYVDAETQINRLMKRENNLSKKDALNRIASQMPLKEKAKKADVLINNNGRLKETIDQVNKWLRKECGFIIEEKRDNRML